MLAHYVTHPQVRIDPAVPVPDWGLSGEGRARAAGRRDPTLGTGPDADRHERGAQGPRDRRDPRRGRWASSPRSGRTSTRTTAAPPVTCRAPSSRPRPTRSSRGPARACAGWETARAAQARILRAVTAALAGHDPAHPVAIIGHGAVGTLLWLALRGEPIARAADQPAGGGSRFAFPIPEGPPLSGWTSIEA